MARFKVIYHYCEESEIEITIELSAENMIQAEETALRILTDRTPKSRFSWTSTELIREDPEPETDPEADPEIMPDGVYYYFDCMDADLADRLIPSDQIGTDRDARRIASDYEAELFRITIQDGQEAERVTLYDPFKIYG